MCGDLFSAYLMGQTGAALRAAAGQNLAAVAGGHSLAEAVLLGTLALLGLIGTEHLCDTSIFIYYSSGSRGCLYSTASRFLSPLAAVDDTLRHCLNSVLSIIQKASARVNTDFLNLYSRLFGKNHLFFSHLHTKYGIDLELLIQNLVFHRLCKKYTYI